VAGIESLDSRSIIATYEEIMNSRQIFNQVGTILELAPAELSAYEATAVVLPDASVLQLTVKGPNPVTAAQIANTMGQESIQYIQTLYNQLYTITVLETAAVPSQPISPQPERDVLISLVLGLAVGMALAIVVEYAGAPLAVMGQRIRRKRPAAALEAQVKDASSVGQGFDGQRLKENKAINWPFMAAITFGLVAALFIIYFAAGWGQAGGADEAASALLTTHTATATGTRMVLDVTPIISDTATATGTRMVLDVTSITTDTATATGTPMVLDVTPTALRPIPTETPTRISTLMPTETPAPTPIPTAVAIEPAIVFRAPDTRTRELDRVQSGETVEVLGRSADRFGRVENRPGLYIRTSEGIEGFVVALFFDWPGSIEALPILQPKLAEVAFNGFLLAAPDTASERLAFVSEGELVEVLGRSGTDWFYVRTEAGIEGFAQHSYLDWRGDFDSLVEYD
jgi:hypothetical protein